MSKLLILGSHGMLGNALIETFSYDRNYEIVAWDKQELDITDKQEVIRAIKALKPEIVINAAAYTDVDGAQTNQELAMKVNGHTVGYLAKAFCNIDAIFIHYSTDYVFDGKNSKGYEENDQPNHPLNVYGESKLLGEQLLLKQAQNGLKYYLIRTSWLFGENGKNFVATMIDLANKHNELKVVNDQYGKPTYTKDLALQTKFILENKLPWGIYHATNESTLTWYDFAKTIFDVKKTLDPNFTIPKLIPVTSDEFPRPAKRPQFSILLNTKLPKGQNIQKALKNYLRHT